MGQQRRDVRYQVQRVARLQEVVALAVVVLAVPDRRAARAVAGQRVAVHGDRRTLVQPDPQQFRMLLHHRGQVVLAVARIHVLIDDGIGDQAKPNLVPWRHHDRVVIRVRRAAHHVRALNGRARRSAHHHSTAVEHPEDLLQRQRAEIRIRQPPVPPAFQIHAGCVLQRGRKLGRVRHLAIRGVQHRALHPGEDRRAVGRQHLLVFGFGDRRRRDHHDVRGLAAGQRDHPVVVRLSARDNQVALRWPMRRQRRLRYCTPCQRDACPRKSRKHLLRAPVFHSSLPRCICPNTIVPRRIRLQRWRHANRGPHSWLGRSRYPGELAEDPTFHPAGSVLSGTGGFTGGGIDKQLTTNNFHFVSRSIAFSTRSLVRNSGSTSAAALAAAG
jgi:hypothetical protein